MSNIALFADRLTAELFSLTDFDVHFISPDASLRQLLAEDLNKKYDIIYVTRSLIDGDEQVLEWIQKKTEAIITVIPGIGDIAEQKKNPDNSRK